MRYVLTFETTHHAMEAQDLLTEDGRKHALIPVPKQISAGCGMAIRFEAADAEEAGEWVMFLDGRMEIPGCATLHQL